jgi:hypothetical protein
MVQHAVFTFSLLGTAVLGLTMLGLTVWLWASFLDSHEHNTRKVRSMMLTFLAVAMMCELGFWQCGLIQTWVLMVSLLVNLWGWLDALLRFPVVHEVDSLFGAKQGLLLVVKTLSYGFGIIELREHIGAFLLMVFLDIWGPPVLYLMALPLRPSKQAALDTCDVDLTVRMWRLTTCRCERQRFVRSCRHLLDRCLFAVSQHSPIMKVALCAASPAYRRVFSKGCRSV